MHGAQPRARMHGDLVVTRGGERGVVCCTVPLVMRSLWFHSYVPLGEVEWRLVEAGFRPDEPTPSEALVERIERYLARRDSATCAVLPTGG